MTLRPQHIYFSGADRKNGYLYDDALGIFCYLDKHELALRQQTGALTSSIGDITPQLNAYAATELPVGFSKMFNLYTGTYRERGPDDGATYFLDQPRDNEVVAELVAQLTPNPEFVQDFLFRALSGAAPNETLLLRGPSEGIFACLDTLYPLTLKPKESFFRRPRLGLQMAQQVKGRKLLYGGEPTITLRRPQGLDSTPLCVVANTISWSFQDHVTTLVTRDYEGKLPYIHQAELLAWVASSKRI